MFFMGCELLTTAKVSLEIVPTGVDSYLDGGYEALGLVSPVDTLLSAVPPPPRLSAPSCVILDMSGGVPPSRLRGAARVCPWNIISLLGGVRKRADGSWWDGFPRRAGGGRVQLRRGMEPDQICHLFLAWSSAQSAFARDRAQVRRPAGAFIGDLVRARTCGPSASTADWSPSVYDRRTEKGAILPGNLIPDREAGLIQGKLVAGTPAPVRFIGRGEHPGSDAPPPA